MSIVGFITKIPLNDGMIFCSNRNLKYLKSHPYKWDKNDQYIPTFVHIQYTNFFSMLGRQKSMPKIYKGGPLLFRQTTWKKSLTSKIHLPWGILFSGSEKITTHKEDMPSQNWRSDFIYSLVRTYAWSSPRVIHSIISPPLWNLM